MIIDGELVFSNLQAVTATDYSTNTVEVIPDSRIGLDMAVQVSIISESGTGQTLSVELETSSNGTTFTKLLGTARPEGSRLFSLVLDGVTGIKKYLRLRYVVGGISPSFKVTSMLVHGGGLNSHQQVQHIGPGIK